MKILIVDDEALARDRLSQILDDSDEYDVVGEAENGEQALEIARTSAPDVVLLDIRMPGMNGIETAHHLNSFESPPAIIFTTAYDEYAIEAFDTRAVGYLLKPVRRERLDRALEQAARLTNITLSEIAKRSGISDLRKHVCAHTKGELKLIPVRDVICFRADQKYVRVQHRNGEDLIDDSLNHLEQEFADEFVRIHRNALVAVRQIDMLKKTADGQILVTLREGSQDEDSGLIISRRHVANVRRRIKGQ
ncbi:MAG: LytTR family DNA-binding domain-containing protein [Proteobacteria bacterium]|nr:LytTR family DNA-binding domain-containing protein [Pseudomonadota bacterium]